MKTAYPRKLNFFLFPSLLVFLTSCQVYRNNGRNLFESAAPTPTNSVGSPTFPVLGQKKPETNCWTQPKDEPLWFAESGKTYQVHFIEEQGSNQILEVCSSDEND